MSRLPHLQLIGGVTGVPYTRVRGGAAPFQVPPRDRVTQARAVRQALNAAVEAATMEHQAQQTDAESRGIQLTIDSQAGFDLKLDSLESRRAGIELLQAWQSDGIERAVIFVPRDKVDVLLKKVDQYEQKATRTGRPWNQPLINSIERVRLAVVRDLWSDARPFPMTDAAMWWEVWSVCAPGQAHSRYDELAAKCRQHGLEITTRWLEFAERLVTLVKARPSEWGRSRILLELVSELRFPVEPARPYLQLSPREQAEWVRSLGSRLSPASPEAPAVCLLDTGVNRGHALLEDSLLEHDTQAVVDGWGAADRRDEPHGTCMAGTALFGDLGPLLSSESPVQLRHRLESVKVMPDRGNLPPEMHGAVLKQAVSLAEIRGVARRRTVCLAVTSVEATGQGFPSSCSAAVDQIAFNDGVSTRLVVVSAGNIRSIGNGVAYSQVNQSIDGALEDPAQAWNALAVGAFTERVQLSPEYEGWTPMAPAGGLTPSSRTSACWDDPGRSRWPLKPDVVFEGGNWVQSESGERSPCPETHLLTTAVHASGAQFDTNADTSAATAQAARLAAMVQADYPRLRPETVRGLVAHSAEWTDAMRLQCPGNTQAPVMKRVRTFGYGVPSLTRALHSMSNAVTLVAEAVVQPYRKVDGSIRSNQMGLHQLPWPTRVLYELGNLPVRMRVTLSYFIEPNPGRRGNIPRTRYASHGLRFDVKRPGESVDQFRQRLSLAERDDPDAPIDNVGETRRWVIGVNGRSRGSLQCDWWEGSAEELASSDHIAVYPVTGWWRERPFLGKVENPAPYSLVVSIETPEQAVDLYTAITTQTEVHVEVVTGQ
jgi:hypothetical protein